MEASFNIINHGLNTNFDHWKHLSHYIMDYEDEMKNDFLDGATWTGSVDTLLDNDFFNYIQKSAPKIIFDYGAVSGFTNFEYVIIPYMSQVGTYGIYALTNNKTKLQLVAIIICYGNTTWNGMEGWNCYGYGEIFSIEEPVENYTPYPNWVESITVDGTVYTYSGYTNSLNQMWVNSQTGQEISTRGCRNPDIGFSAYVFNDGYFDWHEIEDVTYYQGMAPPIE